MQYTPPEEIALKRKIIKWIIGITGIIIPVIFAFIFIFSTFVAFNFNSQNINSDYQTYEQIIEDFVQTAVNEEGTIGGDKYSTWYHGNPTGLPWCSMFVSWAADKVGLIDAGVIPKEQLCYNGIQWFKSKGLFQYTDHYGGNGYIPKRGDIIYFTWDSVKDPLFGHVGIVMYCEGDKVITVEGNTNNNRCSIRTRNRLSSTVLGYGTPDFLKVTGYSPNVFTGNSTAEIVYNFFKAKGFSDAAIFGIMGNLQQESRMDTSTIESNGQGHGLCQWSYGRRQILFDRAAAAGKPWQDIEIQLTLLWDELNGLDTTTKLIMDRKYGGLENFKNTNDIEWAVEAFEKSFERAGKPMMSKRIQYAYQYRDMFANTEVNYE